jgi:uncharacterized protein
MFIEIDRIDSKGLVLDDSVNLDENQLIEEEGLFLEDIAYSIHLSREDDKIRAKGNLRTLVSIPCVRCLDPFELKVNSNFDIILFPVGMIDSTNPSLDPDDMEYIFFEGDRIDLGKILMEQVNLFIPYTPVCNPNCKGLCPNCGANLNYECCQCEDAFSDTHLLFDKIKR